LVVDDFGVRAPTQEAAQHLIDSLLKMYKLHIDRKGKKYLGFNIQYNDTAQEVVLDMPKYIPHMMSQFYHERPLKGKLSPAVYTAPHWGDKLQAPTREDNTPLLDATQIKRVQQIVGSCLFYARAIDSTFLPATCAVSSEQSKPTQKVLEDAERILEYAHLHPNNKLVFKASDMILHIKSDASYLSRSKSRSVGGGVHYLGWKNDPDRVNGPIHTTSFIIPVVCQAVSEAEYAACFYNAQIGAGLRIVLAELEFPQPATPLESDNTCAVGLANQTVAPRKSKSIDMRFHWIQDRVSQKQFEVYWRPGKDNLADFFTKPLPVHVHQEIMDKLIRRNHVCNSVTLRKFKRSYNYWIKKLAKESP
jgi:hypothetical protein